MAIYNIVNMSDPYTIVAPDLEIAAIACVLLGEGQYAFEPLEPPDAPRVPIMLFGSADLWFKDTFNATPDEVAERVTTTRSQELADCLDSCLIGKGVEARTLFEREAQDMSAEARARFRATRHNARRSSLNDIGERAYALAAHFRTGTPPPERPPQQVFTGGER